MVAIPYVPVGWTTTTYRSARNMDHLETMYPDLQSSIDLHTHPNIHYSKTQSDADFYRSSMETGLDAKYIDSLDIITIMGGLAPNGLHLVWKGNDNDFSNGYLISDTRWHLADGGIYGGIYTTDMRGYFPRSSLVNNGTGTGGELTATPTGTVTISDHQLSLAEIPSHLHGFTDWYFTVTNEVAYGSYLSMQTAIGTPHTTTSAGNDAPHDHGTVDITLPTIDKNPIYKSLYFICKVST